MIARPLVDDKAVSQVVGLITNHGYTPMVSFKWTKGQIFLIRFQK